MGIFLWVVQNKAPPLYLDLVAKKSVSETKEFDESYQMIRGGKVRMVPAPLIGTIPLRETCQAMYWSTKEEVIESEWKPLISGPLAMRFIRSLAYVISQELYERQQARASGVLIDSGIQIKVK